MADQTSGFNIEGKKYLTLQWNKDDTPGEPVLVILHDSGERAVATLDTFRIIAQGIHNGTTARCNAWEELWVIPPDSNHLFPCTLLFGGSEKKPKMILAGADHLLGSTLWMGDL